MMKKINVANPATSNPMTLGEFAGSSSTWIIPHMIIVEAPMNDNMPP